MAFSPYETIIAAGCFAGAAILWFRLRSASAITVPAGILFALTGVYMICRQCIKGFADSTLVSYAARGVLVVFLIYLLLAYNNMRAEQNAEFDAPSEEPPSVEESKDDAE